MRRLLDTSAYVWLKRGHDGVEESIRSAERVHVSIVVLGELMSGIHDGAQFERNVAEFNEFLAHPAVALEHLTTTTADRFGRIATELKRTGQPIPTNDVWIAAHAMELGAEVVTFDRHFQRVPGLVVRELV